MPATTPHAGPVVAVIVLGTILDPLDAAMVAVALAPMHTYFGISVAEVSLLARTTVPYACSPQPLFAAGVLITIMNVARRVKSHGHEVDSPSAAR